MYSPTVIIHPTASVSTEASIGPGTRIWNQAQVRENVRIGENCIVGKDVYIDFSVEIGDNVKIQNGALIYHGTTLESGVFIGPGAIFTNDRKPRAINPDGTLKGNDDWEVGPTHVGFGASIGAGAVILPGVMIGSFALVGAGAVVTRNVPAHGLVVGNPSRLVGYVCKCATSLTEDGDGKFRCPMCGEQFQFGQEYEMAK
jgi:UDP-2-acetamido-3-amino-2,3-dideoxy-glucuronate N-acetyltransferase